MKAAFLVAAFALSLPAFGKASRLLVLAEPEVGQINTAMGYSTILQFDSRPTSVVLGDQDGFKVEYVGNSLTIKPVSPGGKTNMFVFTDYDRFNFRVVVGSSQLVDYVVQVKRKRSKEASSGFSEPSAPVLGTSDPGLEELRGNMVTQVINRSGHCNGVTLTLESFAHPKDRPWGVIAFSLRAERGTGFRAEDVVLSLGGKVVPVETLYLEKLEIPSDGVPTRGSLLFQIKSPKLVSRLAFEVSPEAVRTSPCKRLKVALGSSKKPSKK